MKTPSILCAKSRKIGNKRLLVSDWGSWSILSEEEYCKATTNKIEKKRRRELKRKAILLGEDNLDVAEELTRSKNKFLFNGTSLHIVVPTLRCNHVCIYCHSKAKPADSTGYDMDEDTAKKTVDFIFQSPSKELVIEFQGGEPLLNFDRVRDIIDYANESNKKRKKNIRFDLVTNLSAMDHDILKYLLDNKVGLCTSLDGPKEVHDKNRKYIGGSSYDNVVHWIKEIQQDHNYPVSALMVTTKFSLPFWKEIVDEYKKNNLDWIKLRALDNLGYAQENISKIDYSPEEYVEFWKNSIEYLIDLNKKYLLADRMTSYILSKLSGKWFNYVDFQSPCGAAVGQLAYAQDGSIYACDEGRVFDMFKLGSVKENKYKDILTSDQTCSIVAASTNDCLLCDACAYKPFCGICPVCTYAETGTLVPKLAKDSRCKINKALFDYIFEKMDSSPKHHQVFDKWREHLSKTIG